MKVRRLSLSRSVVEENIKIKGIIASGINECNEILMTELLLSDYLDKMDYKYLGAALSFFCDTKPINKESITLNESQTAYECKDVVDYISDLATKFQALENNNYLYTNSYWNINTYIMDAIYEWLDNGNFQEICKHYDIYEGNLIRDLMKIYNMSSELESAALIVNKLGIVTQCSKIRENIIRDIVNIESLYIKM